MLRRSSSHLHSLHESHTPHHGCTRQHHTTARRALGAAWMHVNQDLIDRSTSQKTSRHVGCTYRHHMHKYRSSKFHSGHTQSRGYRAECRMQRHSSRNHTGMNHRCSVRVGSRGLCGDWKVRIWPGSAMKSDLRPLHNGSCAQMIVDTWRSHLS
jgi:hypothetical protein